MSMLVDIATLLTGESNIYYGDLPDTPANVCVLFPTGGFDSFHTLGVQKPSHEEPTLQIRIRDTSYANGITRCEVIKDALDGKCGTTINSNNYISIFMIGDINPIGRDGKNRVDFTMNCKIKLKRS